MASSILLIKEGLLIAALLSLSLYFFLNRGRARYFLQTSIDSAISFYEIFILPYALFIPYLLLMMVGVYFSPYAVPAYLSIIIGIGAGSIIRVFVHAGIHQPQIRSTRLMSRAVHWLYRHDDRAKTFPSTHACGTVLATYYLSALWPMWWFVFVAGGALIILSTLFIKQHYVLDVAGGIGIAILAIIASILGTEYIQYAFMITL